MSTIDSQHGAVHPLQNGQFDPNRMTKFDYYLAVNKRKAGDTFPKDAKTVQGLDALGTAMIEQQGDKDHPPTNATPDSTIPPIYTYWSQFIDHELTASTDREVGGVSVIDLGEADLTIPTPKTVIEILQNRRTPFFDLDAVYGKGVTSRKAAPLQMIEDDLADKLRDGAKMRIGMAAPAPGTPPPTNDLMRDLPRIGQLSGVLMPSDFPNEADPLKKFETKAFIGDPRNDENLAVAQFHTAMLRFHNEIVNWLLDNDPHPTESPDQLFERARTLARWTFQWLVINDFLKKIADAATVDYVIANRAPIYQARYDQMKGEIFMPLEFSVGAYRFGHSMIRNAYDFNRNFGRGANPIFQQASLNQLFQFTGNAPEGGEFPRFLGQKSLPSNWIIEWDRFTGMNPLGNQDGQPARFARKIDTNLAPPLGDLIKEGNGSGVQFQALLKHLARRNLRRGYVLSIPTGQAMANLFGVTALTPDELRKGTGETIDNILRDFNFDEQTPLWYYILREAEIGGGNRLGALGSRMVAETFVGLMVNDSESYLAQDPTWHPGKPIPGVGGPLPLQRTMTKISDLLRFAKVMA